MITIRKQFSLSEISALYEIEKECFEQEFRWAEAVFREELLLASFKHNIWIIEVDGVIAGYLLAQGDKRRGHIITVNISQVFRRQGLASKLIAICEEEFKGRGYSEMKLEVHVDNPAQVLYFNLGYRATGVKRHYYKLHSHALSMSKKI